MKTLSLLVGLIILGAAGYYFFKAPAAAPVTESDQMMQNGAEGKIDINAVCEGALAYMTFPNGAEADAWVQACKRGEHPEAIDQYKQMMGIPGPSSAMRVEDNMILVNAQRPGTTVTVAQVYLKAPGFVVIHEDKDGAPGPIIGSSALLPAGESSQVAITLSRTAKNGEQLHAMLHSDTNGDGKFVAAADAPVPSSQGGPIMSWFSVSTDASDLVPINL